MVAAHSVLALKESHGDWLEIWDRWDASHYLKLAERGYTGIGPDRVSLVFYPLYPWLVQAVMFVTSNVSLAAFIVSGVAAIAAALLLKRLARFDHGEEIARASVWFLLVFPTSYFLHIAYTESLFLALTLGCFVAARSNRWAIGRCTRRARIAHAREWSAPHARSRGRGFPAIARHAPDQPSLAVDRRGAPRLPRLSLAELSRDGRSLRLLADHGEALGSRNSRRRGSACAMSGYASGASIPWKAHTSSSSSSWVRCSRSGAGSGRARPMQSG